MLQQEHEKAQRKIQETSKKTEELLNLRQANDEKYIKVNKHKTLTRFSNKNSSSANVRKRRTRAVGITRKS